jgi:hypothetical protein
LKYVEAILVLLESPATYMGTPSQFFGQPEVLPSMVIDVVGLVLVGR